MQTKAKPCKHCGRTDHFAFQCGLRPMKPSKAKVRKPIPKVGKITKSWIKIRQEWFRANPAEFYTCSLKTSLYCQGVMTRTETTLDHTIPKSNAKNYANRHDFSNLVPSCYPCNSEKGSKHG